MAVTFERKSNSHLSQSGHAHYFYSHYVGTQPNLVTHIECTFITLYFVLYYPGIKLNTHIDKK